MGCFIMEEIKKNKLTFEVKLKCANQIIKSRYEEIREYMLKYGLKSRICSTKEVFRKKGALAQIKIAGKKSLRVYLAIRPEPFIEEGLKVYQIDDTLAYKAYPTMIKITSKKSLEVFKLLFDILMIDKEFKLSRRYVQSEYFYSLCPSGVDVFTFLRLDANLNKNYSTVEDTLSVPDEVVNYIPVLNKQQDELETIDISLELLNSKFKPLDIINVESLIAKKIIKAPAKIHIKAEGVLKKAFTIIADEFDLEAIKMIYVVGGKVIKIN